MSKFKIGDRVQYIGCSDDKDNIGTVTSIESEYKVWVKYDIGNDPLHCANTELVLIPVNDLKSKEYLKLALDAFVKEENYTIAENILQILKLL